MTNLTLIRHDDFDFRMSPEDYIAIHEEFIKANLVETAVLQFTQDGRLQTFHPKLIEYMRTAPNWDFQLHGWAHTHYDEMKPDAIVKEMGAAMFFAEKLFAKTPTLWCTPWNCWSNEMEQAAKAIGLTIDNESYDIAKFIRNVEGNSYDGHSLYFHGWKSDEMLLFPKMIECAKKVYAKV